MNNIEFNPKMPNAPEELAQEKLLPMHFVTLPFLKRVEICAIWARKKPEYRAVLLTWLMALWEYDACSMRPDAERNKILSLARYDSLRTVLRFVRRVEEACERRSRGDGTAVENVSATIVRDVFAQFVAEGESERKCPAWLSAEELCRNGDWAYAGLYDQLIPGDGPKPIAELLDELARNGSGPFMNMVQSGACDAMDVRVDQLFLYLVARSLKYDNLEEKALKCVRALVERHPEVLKARDKSGDGPLWQLFYSGEQKPLRHLQSIAQYLIYSGCDPDEKSSIGLSYNDVMANAELLVGGKITADMGVEHTF